MLIGNHRIKLLAGFVYLMLMSQSNLKVIHSGGFTQYEVEKLYFIGGKVQPSTILPVKIKSVELVDRYTNKPINDPPFFDYTFYFDKTHTIGTTSMYAELPTKDILNKLTNQPIKDADGNYSTIFSLKAHKTFNSEDYKNYAFMVHYTVGGWPKSFKMIIF